MMKLHYRTEAICKGCLRLLFLTGILVVLVSCAVPVSVPVSLTAVAPTEPAQDAVNIVRVEAQPFAAMLPLLPSENQERLLAFAATIPEPLPELASASSVFLHPFLSLPEPPARQIVKLHDGHARGDVAIANPGSNINQPNVLCLRNGVQVACTPEVDVWEVWLPPATLAILEFRIVAEPGDQLTLLFIPSDEPKRLFPGSQLLHAFVEEVPQPPLSGAYAKLPPAEQPVFGDGCNFDLLLPDVSPAESLRIPYIQERGTILHLLIKPCDPPSDRHLVRLTPIINRIQVVVFPGEIWQQPVQLVYPASVLPIDTRWLDSAGEFQVAFIPVGQAAISELDWLRFSFAVQIPSESN
jgi:hypothetical protein